MKKYLRSKTFCSHPCDRDIAISQISSNAAMADGNNYDDYQIQSSVTIPLEGLH